MYKNIIYIFILRWGRLCVVGIQPVRVRTYLSPVAGTFFVKLCDIRRTYTRSWQVCLSDQRFSHFVRETSRSILFDGATSGPLLFVWATTGTLPSVKNYRPYIVFYVPWKHLFAHVFFFLWLVIGTYILPGFFSDNLLILSANRNIRHTIHRQ